jgi:hypothetical protein
MRRDSHFNSSLPGDLICSASQGVVLRIAVPLRWAYRECGEEQKMMVRRS